MKTCVCTFLTLVRITSHVLTSYWATRPPYSMCASIVTRACWPPVMNWAWSLSGNVRESRECYSGWACGIGPPGILFGPCFTVKLLHAISSPYLMIYTLLYFVSTHINKHCYCNIHSVKTPIYNSLTLCILTIFPYWKYPTFIFEKNNCIFSRRGENLFHSLCNSATCDLM